MLGEGFGQQPSLAHLEPVNIPTKSGDLLIWNRLLPHGNSVNTSSSPRLAQFIAMNPAQEMGEEVLAGRVSEWRTELHTNRPAQVRSPAPPPVLTH